MNDRPVRPAPPPPYRRPWSLAGALERLLALLSMVALGWLLSIALEWGGMAFDLWEEPGAGHSTRLLQTELTWLRQDLAPITGPPRLWDWTQEGARLGYRWSGLEALITWLVTPAPQEPSGLTALRRTLLTFGDYLLAAAQITQLVGARLAVVLLSLPAFAVAAVMGILDGLVQRDLRRFGGAVESSFLYHHLKKLLTPLIGVPILIYLAAPWPLHPTVVFIPPALAFGGIVQRTVARFKKYL
jgi:integrating conjugative element membrane protein (TIGR03747 family)